MQIPHFSSLSKDGASARSLPSLVLVAATGVLAWTETGSIDAGDWLLYAIFAALLLALVLAVGVAAEPPRAAVLATSYFVRGESRN